MRMGRILFASTALGGLILFGSAVLAVDSHPVSGPVKGATALAASVEALAVGEVEHYSHRNSTIRIEGQTFRLAMEFSIRQDGDSLSLQQPLEGRLVSLESNDRGEVIAIHILNSRG